MKTNAIAAKLDGSCAIQRNAKAMVDLTLICWQNTVGKPSPMHSGGKRRNSGDAGIEGSMGIGDE
jgi:hypothetical protein